MATTLRCASRLAGHLIVNVHRYLRRSVPEQFLYYFHIFPVALKKSEVGTAERLPRDSLVDAETLDHRLDVVTHDRR